jgi:tRNA pseudouridine synthase 8/2,5-diamino-6-(5-phospho-D-ribitylamino)-pyrimidin-4(3H)-one deaminase
VNEEEGIIIPRKNSLEQRFMSIALKLSMNCDKTTAAFNVGCVLVDIKGNEVISMGYSRELPGNTHAEECAIMKLPEDYSGVFDLYTTMIPCSKRLSGKKSCSQIIIENKKRIRNVYYAYHEPENFVLGNNGQDLKDVVKLIKLNGFETEILKLNPHSV